MHADWLTSLSGLCRNEDLPQPFWESNGAWRDGETSLRPGGASLRRVTRPAPEPWAAAPPAPQLLVAQPPLSRQASLLWLACCGVALASFAVGFALRHAVHAGTAASLAA